MSNVHVASAANEVAQALPSTATVTVSKHGIQAIETLNLDAQSASDKSLTWSRTFSGMEILTNPVLQYKVQTTFTAKRATADRAGKVFMDTEALDLIKKHLRLRSDPIANAASSINVTINNASMAIQPARDHRIVNTTYPDEPVVSNQRHHYGLNQLDRWAEPREREFTIVTEDDVERQFNNNALRQNYPSRLYAAENVDGNLSALNGPGTFHLIDDVNVYTVICIAGLKCAAGTTFIVNATNLSSTEGDEVQVGKIITRDFSAGTSDNGTLRYCTLLGSDNEPIRLDNIALASNLYLTDDGRDLHEFNADVTSGNVTAAYPRIVSAQNMYIKTFSKVGASAYASPTPFTFEYFKIIYDVSQPLAHPYFRDNVMRDNTLVNARYFDCQITISDVGKLVEAVNPGAFWSARSYSGAKFSYIDETTVYTTTLLQSTSTGIVQTTPELKDGSTVDAAAVTQNADTPGMTPRLIFDLITPSVPLPTISDKVVSTFHTMTSSSVSSLPAKGLKSGNIQLSQIPDKIYVFCKSSFMESKASTLQTHCRRPASASAPSCGSERPRTRPS